MPTDILEYLKARAISEDVIEMNSIGWDGNRIVIPVYDRFGNFLFNKYRRSPFSEEGPKYTYDKGSSSALYHINVASRQKGPIIICEGELDCLVLETKGFRAITSTGGSMSFDEEWKDFFRGEEIILFYDSDDAGQKGMVHTLVALVQKVKVVTMGQENKDITDFVVSGGNLDEVMNETYEVFIPELKEVPSDTKALKKKKSEIRDHIDNLLSQKREMDNKNKDTRFFEYLIDILSIHHEAIATRLIPHKGRNMADQNKVQRAISYPMQKLLVFDRQGFASCPLHTEDTPSCHLMKRSNKAYCFGCSRVIGPIDIIMHNEGLTFKEAVERLQ